MTGRLFLIVGPSGAGKDTIIAHAARIVAPDDGIVFARRIITRPLHPGGSEQHIAVTPGTFAKLRAAGSFALDWDSHNLSYGIGVEVRPWLEAGLTVVANGSRAALPAARRVFGEALVTVEVTAPPQTLLARLAARGRESPNAIAARLERSTELETLACDVCIANDGPVDIAVAQLMSVLRRER